MNPRTRRARRILRDHRRRPDLGSHINRTDPFGLDWTCPRCTHRGIWTAPWDEPVIIMPARGQLVSGQWRLSAMLDRSNE